MSRDNLEHGWIVKDREEDLGEIIGYCEDCGGEIREYTYYKKRCGYYLCENCDEGELKRIEEQKTIVEDE